MSLLVTAAHHTAIGQRERNDDFAGLVMPAEASMSARVAIAAIADGVSGSIDGQQAAEYSVRTLLADFYTTPDSLPVAEALEQVIKSINIHVHRMGSRRSAQWGMATTLTALVTYGKHFYFTHVGDSRLYLLRDGRLDLLTIDHVQDHADRRHVLTRAIGLDAPIVIDHGTGELQQGDIFLLASDGVWGALSESDLEWHLSTLAEDPPNPDYTAKLLVDAALANGTKDNATALVLRVLSLPPD